MKTILSFISIITLFLLSSCDKNIITFGSTDIDMTKSAEVRLVYDLPIVSVAAMNITRLTYNDLLVSEVSTPLGGSFPNSAAKYHVVPQGLVKVDAYIGTKKDVAQYSNTFTLSSGKYSAFIYSATEAPLVIKDVDVFPSSDAWADTTAYIQFVNLLYKSDGVTPYGTLTLKGKRGEGTVASPYEYINIATCAFKESSTLISYKLLKKGTIWSGTEEGLTFVVFDTNGNQLQYFKASTGGLSDWSSTSNSLTKGRNYILHINGKQGVTYADQSIRLSIVTLR